MTARALARPSLIAGVTSLARHVTQPTLSNVRRSPHEITPGNEMTIAPGDSRLAGRLRNEIRGEVLFSRADRGRYATDASIYQVEPIGVVVPEEIGDVAAAMAIAREEGIPVLPRGGGTSQCGQTVNRALVIDCSKHLRRILDIDPEARTALVEPGLVLGHLNAALRQHGLFFPVDPSTHARCTIGGMAGNNSCGSKSIRYGLMADNVRAIDAILADGTQHKFGVLPDNIGADVPRGIADLIQRLRALGAAEAEEIAARFPSPASPRRRLQHRGTDAGGTPCRRGEPRAAAGGIGGHARLLRRDRTCAAPDQAAQTARHLPVPHLPQRDGGGAAHRAARPRGGGAGRSHDDRPRPRHPDLPRHDRPHADRRAGLAADRRVPRPRGCAARGEARRARRADGRTRLSRRRGPRERCRHSRPISPRCARPASTS